jgi:hypothetical protein
LAAGFFAEGAFLAGFAAGFFAGAFAAFRTGSLGAGFFLGAAFTAFLAGFFAGVFLAAGFRAGACFLPPFAEGLIDSRDRSGRPGPGR